MTGRVRSSADSSSLTGAVLTLNSDAIALTDSAGTFQFVDVDSGTNLLAVRRFGYEPVELAIWVDSTVNLTISLNPTPYQLEGLDVVADEAGVTRRLAREGFYERRRYGNGHFYDRDHIARMNVVYTRDILHLLPQRFRTPCAFFVDGIQIDTQAYTDPLRTLDILVKAEMIEAIEIYDIGAVPMRFNVTRDENCPSSLLVIWTR